MEGVCLVVKDAQWLTIAANTSGTVFFSAPLFRPNLHYKVLAKPSNAKTAIEKMGKWINENHS
jgi:ATP-dependent DNA helicase Q1